MSFPPDILHVFTDQQRASSLGCAGVELVCTPHLNAFAAQGARFTRPVANTPSCAPSRATLTTADKMYPGHTDGLRSCFYPNQIVRESERRLVARKSATNQSPPL